MKKGRKAGTKYLRRLVIVAAGIAAVKLAGCGMQKEAEREQMLSYMRQKYEEEFDFEEDYAGQAGKSYTMILASSRENPERKALVRIRREGGERYFEDNYSAFLLKNELEEKITALSEPCFGPCKVFYKIPEFVFPEEFGADMSADEFLRHPCSGAQFYIYPEQTAGSGKEWVRRLAAFGRMNEASGYQIRGTVSLPESKKDYDMISEQNFDKSDYQGYEPMAELVFSMDEDGAFRYMRWMNQKVREKGED